MYKTAMLGCGGRARGHADAYRFVKRGKLAAICDMNTEIAQQIRRRLWYLFALH